MQCNQADIKGRVPFIVCFEYLFNNNTELIIWVNTENTIVIPKSSCAVAQSDRSGHEDKGGAKALSAKSHIWPDWQRHKWDCDGNQDTL